MSILNILAQKKIIDERDVLAIKEESESQGLSVEEILKRMGVKPEDILAAKSEDVGIPMRSVGDSKSLSQELFKYIPEESAIHYKFVPLDIKDGVLEVGVVDPDSMEARDALNFISSRVGMPFKIFLISEEDFTKTMQIYKSLAGEVVEALSEYDSVELSKDDNGKGAAAPQVERAETKAASERELDAALDDEPASTKIIEDAPVTKIVATILRYATEGEASDIHIEHMQDTVRVRFRVDGILNTSLVLPKKVQSAVIARIKILANMRLDEKRKPQDGRFSAKIDGRKIDFRVSTFPTYYGEKIVMRILDHEKGVRKLDEIGLSKRNLDLIREALNRPYGLVLVSGPTGSGKTTTLYSMLNEVDREQKNVLSLEDPVEYSIQGVNQSQVRPDIGYTFANGLRTTLRQDPDVIMVGEIRDRETAQLAIQAALTGHLVLSTIHTNNAIGVIPRLVDMGVDPYLIAPTLILAIAQRLVSKLCPGGGKERAIDGALKVMIDKQFEDLPVEYKKHLPKMSAVYEKTPTADCPEGVRGRVAVMEVLPIDKELERVILSEPTENKIYEIARKSGMLTMKEDAIIKAVNREIPFEEVNTL